MRNIGLISALAGAALLSGCAQQLEQVKQVNQALAAISNPQTSSGQLGIGGRQPSPAQAAAVDSNLNTAIGDRAIAEARREASSNISKLLRIMSCTPQGEYPQRYLNSMAAPGANVTLYPPPAGTMRYHPKSQCLTVTRLDGWRMQAKNALQFRAVYTSDASGESSNDTYTFIKQPDGFWLLGSPT
ncbi:hypothetical protein QTI66_05595 [Variovorax sp. J22R133]|uniref:hypothetical protein n=1 Tax=Variovorax brevis TaxID=3053503 RepID=UPI0025761CE9|nr:hypothetical protein [Variovorax sp. J22R133]MDM0111612.1 hypothetical protein [Variovorax sp. J22R133]